MPDMTRGFLSNAIVRFYPAVAASVNAL
uniref:Uncharacterized protein n=1 Tax=mine drainage metagenome TaxID=410659 RepID=E6Q7G1_9ZZZZ